MRKEFPNPKGSKAARYSYGDFGFAAELLRDSIGKLFPGHEMTPLTGCERSQRRCSEKEAGNRWGLGAAAPPIPPEKRLRSALPQTLIESEDPHASIIPARMAEKYRRRSISG